MKCNYHKRSRSLPGTGKWVTQKSGHSKCELCNLVNDLKLLPLLIHLASLILFMISVCILYILSKSSNWTDVLISWPIYIRSYAYSWGSESKKLWTHCGMTGFIACTSLNFLSGMGCWPWKIRLHVSGWVGMLILCGNGSQMASYENVILYSTRPVHGYRNALRLCTVGSPAFLPGRMLVT